MVLFWKSLSKIHFIKFIPKNTFQNVFIRLGNIIREIHSKKCFFEISKNVFQNTFINSIQKDSKNANTKVILKMDKIVFQILMGAGRILMGCRRNTLHQKNSRCTPKYIILVSEFVRHPFTLIVVAENRKMANKYLKLKFC